ncbi:prostaglandin E2 receptor EP4 subtype [Sipha flava]|uniref:Prostaglandin E2 receptor EP3 subtype n=1 Tax=Sipha flava TaxID=143950 RepID=A0A2S2QFR6_9HEMI|nr:prostaglandin E2 receptor EP4 subtype [Sipha flava]
MSNATAAMSSPDSTTAGKSPSFLILAMLTVGVCGNLLALFVLSRIRNNLDRRHKFLLRCLATNDCVAVAGMLAATIVRTAWPQTVNNVWTCRQIVLWRFFGLGSGCVAVLMAVERWLAITRPFFYQKYITESILKRITIVLWLTVLCLVCAPFFGFGIYWNDNLKKCSRIRDAKESLDVIYAYVFFSFGVVLCIVITCSNLDVIIALCTKERNNHINLNKVNADTSSGALVRNVDRNNEERLFSWLMLFLCVSFVVCWLPQLLSIPLAQFFQNAAKLNVFYKIADLLLVLHFSLDPYLYVLQQWKLVRSTLTWSKYTRNNTVSDSSVTRASLV